jgi:hypothetical protein
MNNNVKVVGKDSKGEEVTCFVRRPTSKDSKEAKLYANAVVAKTIKSGTFLTRSQARDTLKAQGIWGDEQEQKLREYADQITGLVKVLQSGKNDKGVQLKKSEGKQISLDLIRLRNEQLELLTKVNELDEYTIEAQAENDEFDYLFSVCLLDESGELVFESVDDYKVRAADEPYYFTAAQELQGIIYGFRKPEEIANNRIEYKFLKKNGFINDKLQFVNKDGHPTDKDGKLIDDEGYYVNNNEEREINPDVLGEFLDD